MYQLTRIGNRSFWQGFVLGLLVCVLAGAVGAMVLLQRGVSVVLDVRSVAGIVQTRIQTQAGRDLSKAIAGVKSEIPRLVAQQMQGQVAPATIQLAGVTMPLGETVTRELEKYLQARVEVSIIQVLDRINTGALAEKMGDDAREWIMQSLSQDLNGSIVTVQPVKGVSLPVTLMVME